MVEANYTYFAMSVVCSYSDHYLSSVTWVTEERIAVQWQKRIQNYVLLQIYDFDGSHWNEKGVRFPCPSFPSLGHFQSPSRASI